MKQNGKDNNELNEKDKNELSKNLLEENINILEENNINNLNSGFKSKINFFENYNKKNKDKVGIIGS